MTFEQWWESLAEDEEGFKVHGGFRVNEGFARLGWDAVAERMAELDRQIQYQHDANMALEHANLKLHEGYLELKAEIRELKSENRSLVQRYVRATGAVPL